MSRITRPSTWLISRRQACAAFDLFLSNLLSHLALSYCDPARDQTIFHGGFRQEAGAR